MGGSGGGRKGGTASLTMALVGLWPIVGAAVLWALTQWGGGESDFTLDPRDTSRNVLILGILLAATFASNVAALVIGLRGLWKGAAARGRAVAGVILAAVGTLFLAAVFTFALVVRSMLPAGGGDKLTRDQRLVKCRGNQKNIATMLGPEMWGFDHPDAKPEDLKKLDLSPAGELIHNDTGIAYTTDPSILNCPADKDRTDVDYAVEITPEGQVKVRCIDRAGVKEGHNAP